MAADSVSKGRMDHLVVVMFENRSFDNLLGYLYSPAERPGFEGVTGRVLSNPTPQLLLGTAPASISVHPSRSFAAPYPDPGEEYPHVNTQLFGTVLPESNRFLGADDMSAPYNLADPPGAPPPMSGFVQDYVDTFRWSMGRLPDEREYSQIMACYTPDQVPVLSGLAKGFACFDHWFCEVPSQTYPNRSFFHAATSSGFVLNGSPPGKFAIHNTAPTIFERLEASSVSWKIYFDPAQILPATALIHASRLLPRFADRFHAMDEFYDDARRGTLPNYAFIEPNMFHPHTDMHPHSGARLAEGLHLPAPETLLGGEQLLARVYGAVRGASASAGSGWRNTVLLVTFDEHGGTFDHVPPPSALPPDATPGEQGFRFDRLGVRIPTLVISPWVPAGTVVSGVYRSTSVIRTLRDYWGLGGPLTARDADAPSLLTLLSAANPREPESWPSAQPRSPTILEEAESLAGRLIGAAGLRMEGLERDMLGDALALELPGAGRVVRDPRQLSHSEAHQRMLEIRNGLLPHLNP